MEFVANTIDGTLVSCGDSPPAEVIFGQTSRMREIERIVGKVANTNMPILIQGERGAGKEVLGCYIHLRHPGPAAPFFKVTPPIPKGNALDEVAFRVEEKGFEPHDDFAYPEPGSTRLCTLFVKDVADLDAGLQFELLQLIQGSKSFVIGTRRDIPVALRVICASTRDLLREVEAGRFREDLLLSISAARLHLPPLQERRGDIPQLVQYFWAQNNKKFRCQANPPSPHWINLLQEYDWPGNIRELENVVKRYVVLGSEDTLGGHLAADEEQFPALKPSQPSTVSLKKLTRDATQALERKIILRTLQQTQWNRKLAARALKISYRALLYKIKEAGLPPKRQFKQKNKERQEPGPGSGRESTQDAA